MDSAILLLTILGNAGVAVAYVGLGIVFYTKFDTAAPTWKLWAFRVAALGFFVECAATHGHELLHQALGTPVELASWVHLLITLPQAIFGLLALALAVNFISARIYDRSFYSEMIERRFDEETRQIAAAQKQTDIRHLAEEVSTLNDAVAALDRAMRGGES